MFCVGVVSVSGIYILSLLFEVAEAAGYAVVVVGCLTSQQHPNYMSKTGLLRPLHVVLN